MKVVIPLFEEDVAPRFCAATHALVADIEAGEVIDRQIVPVPASDLGERLEQFSELGASVLLCGGFNRRFLALARNLGLHVEVGLVGRAEDLLTLWLAHEPMPRLRGRGRGRRRRHRRWHGAHHD